MVIGHCTYTLKEGCAEAFVREVDESGFFRNSRNEEGNISYTPYFSAEDPNTVFVIECWKNYEDIAKHEKTPHLADLNAVAEKYLISVTLEYHEVGKQYDPVHLTLQDMLDGYEKNRA